VRSLSIVLMGLVASVFVWFAGIYFYEERALSPAQKPGEMGRLASNQDLVTVNTTRIGSDDPVETAVAVAQIIYPVTEEENSPGAVILINRANLAEALVAASRVQHFPVNAPLLYVDENRIPELTQNELLRLTPEGVAMDGNVQVYLVGTIGDEVRRQVEELGYRTRVLRATGPTELAEVVDDWSSTQHGDHKNDVVIANLDNLEPAIPSAFWNAHMGDGLAFVTDAGIPESTRRMLRRRAHGPWLYLFGDESVISTEIARELAQYGQVTRMPRSGLPEISTFFAGFKDIGANWGAWYAQDNRDFGWGISEAGHNAIFVNVGGPEGWQNALPATTLSHMGKHAPMLAVNRDGVPDVVRTYLEILKPYPTAPQQQLLNHGWIIGGERTISWETQVALDGLLEGQLAVVEASSQ
jgi:hypothetical protein